VSVAAFIYASPAKWLGQLLGKADLQARAFIKPLCPAHSFTSDYGTWFIKVGWTCQSGLDLSKYGLLNYLRADKGSLLVSFPTQVIVLPQETAEWFYRHIADRFKSI